METSVRLDLNVDVVVDVVVEVVDVVVDVVVVVVAVVGQQGKYHSSYTTTISMRCVAMR